MPLRWTIHSLPLLLLVGCAGIFQVHRDPLYDFTVGTTYPGGVSVSLWTNPDLEFLPIGSIGDVEGKTWVACRRPLPDSIEMCWRNRALEDYLVRIPLRTITPPITARQKYHITVLIHRGDSVSTDIRVLDRDDCSHLVARSKAYSGPGPCAY